MKVSTEASFILEELESAFIGALDEGVSASDASILATIALDRVYNPLTPRYKIVDGEIVSRDLAAMEVE